MLRANENAENSAKSMANAEELNGLATEISQIAASAQLAITNALNHVPLEDYAVRSAITDAQAQIARLHNLSPLQASE